MTEGPISFTPESLRPMLAGTKVETRRPHGRYARLSPGDRLWVREAFHLAKRFDAVAPTVALERGAHVVFWPVDHDAPPVHANIGRKRFARELPRAVHRFHLVVRAVRSEPLQAIDDAGARAEGCADVAGYRAVWEAMYPATHAPTLAKGDVRWAANPLVDVIAFRFVAAPLPGGAA